MMLNVIHAQLTTEQSHCRSAQEGVRLQGQMLLVWAQCRYVACILTSCCCTADLHFNIIRFLSATRMKIPANAISDR